jgi:hypothetical protein
MVRYYIGIRGIIVDNIFEVDKFLQRMSENPEEVHRVVKDRVGEDLIARVNQYAANVSNNVGQFTIAQIISTSIILGYILKTHLYRKEMEDSLTVNNEDSDDV